MVLGLKKKDSKMDNDIPSVDKAPSKYQKYEWKLSHQYKEIGLKVLHESEGVRNQAIAQFREWIAKDPYIKAVRTDPNFLLRFLRTTKFNVPAALAMLQRYLTSHQKYSTWFRNLDILDPKLGGLYDDGFLIPLPRKDHMGRQVIIYNVGALDPSKYTSDHVFQLQEFMFQTFLEDEETQVAGYMLVFDYSAITMQHCAMFSLTDFRNFITCVKRSFPIRISTMLVLNLPTFLMAFYEITMAVISPKLRSRFRVCKTLNEFSRQVDIKMFPKDVFEGDEDTSRILTDFKKRMLAKRERIQALDLMEIDDMNVNEAEWYKCDGNGNFESGIIGSFRKLEVD